MDENISRSPSPSRTLVVSNLDFYQALKEMMNHKKVTKVDWNEPEFYGVINEGHLRLHKPDQKMYDWILTEEDIIGDDYVIIT